MKGGRFSLGFLRGRAPVVVVDLVAARGGFGVNPQGLPAGPLGEGKQVVVWISNSSLIGGILFCLLIACSPPLALPAGLKFDGPSPGGGF